MATDTLKVSIAFLNRSVAHNMSWKPLINQGFTWLLGVLVLFVCLFCFLFRFSFKKKTAYELTIILMSSFGE